MKTTFFLFLGVLIAGCHLSGKGGGPLSGDETELTGTWRLNCLLVGTGNYIKHTLVFGTAEVSSLEEFFGDANCTTPRYTRMSTGSYSILGSAAAVSSAKELNVDFTTREITLYASDLLSEYAGVCNITTWVIGQTEDCSAYVLDLYQIYQLATINLTLGQITSAYDGTTSVKRPRIIDPLKIFLKL